MSKKNKWWFSETDEDQSVLFPNTVKQHNEKMNAPVYKQGQLISGDDYSEDYYGWGKKPIKKELGVTTTEDDEFKNNWNKSWNSGESWKGYSYYRTPTLSYRYVQQMANALAAQHKIEVKIGNDWDCNLTTRTLTYNPASLVYSSKSELLATLLHEIGKPRYSMSYESMQYKLTGQPHSRFINEYEVLAYTAMLPFEELRIDTKMLGEYGSAGEIYESQEPSLIMVYKNYKKMSVNYKKASIEMTEHLFEITLNEAMGIVNNGNFEVMMMAKKLINNGMNSEKALQIALDMNSKGTRGNTGTTRVKMLAAFGVETEPEARAELAKMIDAINKKDTIYDYIASMYSSAYLLKKENDFTPEMVDRVAKTSPSFKPIVKFTTTLEVLKEMDDNVFPVIEDLLKQDKNGMDALDKFGQRFKQQVSDYARQAVQGAGGGNEMVDSKGNQKVRTNGSAPTNKTTVPEWFNGDYKVLKDSVRSEITRLTRMLNFLRRTEQTVKWVSNQRRGRLNMKKLYRARLGNRRVFKSRLESTDTVRSFAFSILLDVSGSMDGARITNTTRGMIILAEVFKDMQIPFEIITFSEGAKTIKSFGGSLDSKVEKMIGGLPQNRGGGTNLNKGIEKMKLKEQKERNKICIVLTDGGVGDPEHYNSQYFRPMLQKEHIKSLAFGLEISEREIGKLCNGTGKAIKNAVEVPYIFADLLKSLMLKK